MHPPITTALTVRRQSLTSRTAVMMLTDRARGVLARPFLAVALGITAACVSAPADREATFAHDDPQVRLVPGVELNGRREFQQTVGKATVDLRGLRVVLPILDSKTMAGLILSDVDKKRGGPIYRDILIVFDPKSGAYWWESDPVADPASAFDLGDFPGAGMTFFVGDGRIALMRSSPSLPVAIWIHDSDAHAADIREAQSRVLGAIRKRPAAAIDTVVPERHIALDSVLPSARFKEEGAFARGPTLTRVEHENGRWHFAFRGVNGHTGMVDVDDSYNVLPATGGFATITDGYTLDHRIDIASSGLFDLRKLRVNVEMPEGYSMLRDVVIIHGPRQQTYWWAPLAAGPQPRRANELDDYPGSSASVYAGSGGIAVARVDGSSLLLRTSTSRAPSIEDAQRAVVEAISHDPELVRKPDDSFHTIDLTTRLEPPFFDGGGADHNRAVAVRSIARGNGRWLIALEGPHGDLADLEIADDFTLLNARRHR